MSAVSVPEKNADRNSRATSRPRRPSGKSSFKELLPPGGCEMQVQFTEMSQVCQESGMGQQRLIPKLAMLG
jgi:hypothetical protein